MFADYDMVWFWLYVLYGAARDLKGNLPTQHIMNGGSGRVLHKSVAISKIVFLLFTVTQCLKSRQASRGKSAEKLNFVRTIHKMVTHRSTLLSLNNFAFFKSWVYALFVALDSQNHCWPLFFKTCKPSKSKVSRSKNIQWWGFNVGNHWNPNGFPETKKHNRSTLTSRFTWFEKKEVIEKLRRRRFCPKKLGLYLNPRGIQIQITKAIGFAGITKTSIRSTGDDRL